MQVSITTGMARTILKRTFTPYDSESMYAGSSTSINSRPGETTYAYWLQSGVVRADKAYLALCKGTVPSNFSGITRVVNRSSDILVSWKLDSVLGTWTEVSDQPEIYLTSTQRSNADQSGVATWLWWYNIVNDAGGAVGDIIGQQAVFTVGNLGSGAEFELIDTNIVASRGYKIVNAPRLSMATEYSY